MIDTNDCVLATTFINPLFTLADVKQQYPDLFEEKVPVKKVALQLEPGHDVITLPPYSLTFSQFKSAKKMIKELIERKIVRKSKSPYASPCFVKAKQNGDLILIQDYSELKKVTLPKYRMPLPNVDELIASLSGCNYFSKIDLVDVTNQFKLTEETRRFTAFVLPFGKFEMNRLPIGWKNRSAIIQQALKDILSEIPTCTKRRVIWYVDLIVIGGVTYSDCIQMTHSVLRKLQQYNMRIHEENSQFLVGSIGALGRVTDGNYISKRPDLVQKIMSSEQPSDLGTLRKCLDLIADYYAKYIPNYAEIIRPLEMCFGKYANSEFPHHKRLSKFKIQWTEEREKAYDQLIEVISSNPILHLPVPSLPFHVIISVTEFLCRSSYFQVHPEQLMEPRLIGFHSYNFKGDELCYSSEEKECFAVAKALEQFPWYAWNNSMLDVPIIVHTDLEALGSVMNRQELTLQQIRWKKIIIGVSPRLKQRTPTDEPL